jgi:hypothetical protein
MRPLIPIAAFVVLLGLAGWARAQFQDEDPGGFLAGKSKVQRWRAGLTIEAVGGPCKGITGYLPLPREWPEQDVRIVEQDISSDIKLSYEVLDGTVKIMVVKIPLLPGGKEAHALITFEIRRNEILPPEKTDQYVLPDRKKLDRAIAPYLQPSPKIESRDAKIVALAKEIGADKATAWEKVEAIYDWVRAKLSYKKGAPLLGALAVLKSGNADCEDMTSLFIAICRAANIPARTVWVPEHCYPEFYLLDEKGTGHWFPCQIAGSRAFGGIPETRPILQKGDNFQPPWNSKEKMRYMAEHLEGTQAAGSTQPKYHFVREAVAMPEEMKN